MPEHTERQQTQKKDDAQLQAEEIAPEPESLQVGMYQSASSPPPAAEPPDDPNSWQGVQSRFGNQQLQHLLTDAPIQLHRNTIHQLHSAIGNQAVQRLLLTKPSLVPPISLRTGNKSLAQRRVPELEDIDDEALDTDSEEDNEINRRGLREVLRRAIQDLGEPRSTYILDMNYNGNYIRDTLATGTTEQLMDVVRLIENNDFTGEDGRSLVFEDTSASAVPLRRHSNYPQIQAAIQSISDLMIEIGTTSTHDQHLQDVFGDDAQYGWQQAKARFPRTGQQLRQALVRNHIRSDDTGSTEEMDAGALTSPGRQILVTEGCLTDPDSAAAFHIYSHEAFHYAYPDILDDGGYAGSNQGFSTCSASVKFHNADHYGEVCRRTRGIVQTPIQYRPAFQPPTGNPDQITAVNKVRAAWTSAMNMFETFRDQYNRQQRRPTLPPDTVNTLLHHSMLFQLTYHQRHQDGATPINQIDLTLAEGVARRLSETMDATNAVTHIEAHRARSRAGQWTMVNGYIAAGLANLGHITSSTTRDMRMVNYLAELGNDIVNIQDIPPPDLQ